MSKITIWHNPRCSKSREALKAIEETNAEVEVVKYLEKEISTTELKNLLKMLDYKSAREWMRTKEAIYKELNLKNETDEERLIEAMAKNPKLIERPVLIKNDKAIVARPHALIEGFLNS